MRHKVNILWPRHSTRWFREDNTARNGSREKKRNAIQMWERYITDPNTFGQRRPEDHMLRRTRISWIGKQTNGVGPYLKIYVHKFKLSIVIIREIISDTY